jgi:nicotinamidase-related amidase
MIPTTRVARVCGVNYDACVAETVTSLISEYLWSIVLVDDACACDNLHIEARLNLEKSFQGYLGCQEEASRLSIIRKTHIRYKTGSYKADKADKANKAA